MPDRNATDPDAPASPVPPPQRWQDKAACRGEESVDWFPHRDRGGGSLAYWDNLALARALCASCPVAEACLSDALAHEGTAGIWAGTTDADRRKMRTPRPRSRDPHQPIEHGTPQGYQTHRRRGVPACVECRLANAVYHRDRRNGAA